MNEQDQLASLRKLSPNAELLSEGGETVVHLPSVRFHAKGTAVERDLLLWPSCREGYTTRLFLSGVVPTSEDRPWTAYPLCGGTWWAVSWQGVPADLPWIEMVASHLRAFQ